MTTFSTIFQRLPNTSKISEDSSKVVRRPDERFRTFSENFRRLLKISEDNRRFPRTNQQCFDHTAANLRDCVTIATGIFSLVKIGRQFCYG